MSFPDRVISGAIHYFRVHPDLWHDRLERLAAMGLNTVETYVAWNFHSPGPGAYDFTGWRDVARFVTSAQEVGLNVILRPGPYICAEWEFGGLPAWLLRTPGIRLRCSDPAYLAAVDEFLDALIPEVLPLLSTKGGPIIACQVENEYGSYGDDLAYLEHLRDGLVRRGVDVPLFTSDGPGPDYFASGALPGVLATANFGSHAELCFRELERFRPGAHKMCMEFWHGWFDHWGEHHHTRDADEAAGVLDDMLAANGSVNLFMGHGGTNFGLWSGANWDGAHQPTVTSYDYDAPVGEGGEITPKFHAFRKVISRYVDVPDVEPPAPLPRLAPQSVGVDGWADLVDHADAWGAPVRGPMPRWMEEVGSGRGLVLYRGSALVPPDGRDLILDDLSDRAYVYVDGDLVATVDAEEATAGVPLRPSVGGVPTRLEVLVESRGRINFGHRTGLDHKGVSAIRLAHRYLHDWESVAIELDSDGFTDAISFEPDAPRPGAGPTYARAVIEVDAPADGFLALPGWGRGFVWLNGFLLGRYDEVGPQVTLYAPGPLWRAGANQVVVLEMSRPGRLVELRDTADLGPDKEE
ncbi:MAG: beta-galactosidase [Nocardioidaceae bacterium]|nr:beta-galactosidase [Nocardioidaceae bacterium]MCL2613604.1 beta-galactosidase [Nocardioidaceae bacterium]